jgi:MFS family permease
MSVFMQVPFVLRDDGLPAVHHWMIYLPVMLVAFVLMVPPIVIAEKKAKMKQVFMGAVALALLAQLALLGLQHSVWGVAFALLLFFTAFNVLEATLPSLVSKLAPLASKGTAMGVYSSSQFLGAFFGAAVGGFILQYYGGNAVMLFLWLLVASTMRPPAAVSTKMYHLGEIDSTSAIALQQKLAALHGVREVMVVAAEGMACLKVEQQGFDQEGVEKLCVNTQ